MADKRSSERAAWLRENPQVWQPYRLTSRTVKITFEIMQTAGLYSFTTHWYDCWKSLARLIRSIRHEQTTQK